MLKLFVYCPIDRQNGVTRWLIFNIPMLFLPNHLFKMYGIVRSQVTADFLTVLLSLYVYRRHTRTLAQTP